MRTRTHELALRISEAAPDWRALLVPRCAERRRAFLVTFANPYSVWVLGENSSYAGWLQRFDALLADGVLLAKVASRIQSRPIRRLSFDGNSLAPEIFSLAEQRSLTIAVIGGVPGVAEVAAATFCRNYRLSIVSIRSGYFGSEEEMAKYCQELRSLSPDIVICGMGAPYQERFLLALQDAGWKGVGFTCGGYLDQAAEGTIEYYPEWVNRFNLRAPYRFLRNPRRLGKRYLIHYAPFYLHAIKILFSSSHSMKSTS